MRTAIFVAGVLMAKSLDKFIISEVKLFVLFIGIFLLFMDIAEILLKIDKKN